MCGILGLIDYNNGKINKDYFVNSLKKINHRGPDGTNQIYIENIALGHNRLAIIDLSSNASQPMTSFDGRYTLNYNGEIYNFKDLKKILLDLNYKFNSQSDTEVILNGWHAWGENLVKKLNGMFAFSIYDHKSKKIFLCRDRYGVKPIYYSHFKNYLIFSSEIKAIISYPEFEKKINNKILYEYFTFQNIFSYSTLYENINIVEPGTILKINTKKKYSVTSTKYWDYNFTQENKNISFQDASDQLDDILNSSIKNQLTSDVEIGSYLSGGIDSSIVTSIASKNVENLKTFTCGFEEVSYNNKNKFDEREEAQQISNFLNTNHTSIELNYSHMELCFPKLVNSIEEPRLGQSYPNFYAASMASDKVKVVLSGTGGDELFCGYPWRYNFYEANNYQKFIDNYYAYWQRLVSNSDLKKIFQPIKSDVKDVWTKDIFSNVLKDFNGGINSVEDQINASLYFEFKTFLHSLLIIEDKLSMQHSLETRVPLLDNNIVDFTLSCPLKFKLNKFKPKIIFNENDKTKSSDKYFQLTNDGKIILRNVVKNK
ncbi:asparagine synthase (glutamine-hydrolyzing), partial [Alphaproteobacteria bacterium]|nr:asparagine synthase (glutamine-hydrolyzing) [Alphaproteobacteria bacterium]